MHPNRRFHDHGTADLLERAAAIGFAHMLVGTVQGPVVVHAPRTLNGEHLRLGAARTDLIAIYLADASLLDGVIDGLRAGGNAPLADAMAGALA